MNENNISEISVDDKLIKTLQSVLNNEEIINLKKRIEDCAGLDSKGIIKNLLNQLMTSLMEETIKEYNILIDDVLKETDNRIENIYDLIYNKENNQL